jgi:tartrate-resistant acid phosphatase type 5
MEGHYYVKTVKQNGVTVDIFNLDTNEASAHGATQVCCQCFSYRGNNKDVKCNEIDKGSPYCAGGNMDMYNVRIDIAISFSRN